MSGRRNEATFGTIDEQIGCRTVYDEADPLSRPHRWKVGTYVLN
jgi:hypothetical protein